MIFRNDFKTTKQQYVNVLIGLLNSSSPAAELYLRILKLQYYEPSRITNSMRLAKFLSIRNANGVYGKLSKHFAVSLGLAGKLPKRLDQSVQWYRAISIGRSASATTLDSLFEYELRPELAEALEELEVVEASTSD